MCMEFGLQVTTLWQMESNENIYRTHHVTLSFDHSALVTAFPSAMCLICIYYNIICIYRLQWCIERGYIPYPERFECQTNQTKLIF